MDNSLKPEKNAPLFSVCGIVYNNVNEIRRSLDSVMSAMRGMSYEVVIVDNYSTDGTFEILQEYAQNDPNVRVYRYKCSRGLGRQIAYRLSRGKYIIVIDELDCYYDSRRLRIAVEGYLKWSLRDKKCIIDACLICPRQAIESVGGWRDLNRTEQDEFIVRLFLNHLAAYLPTELRQKSKPSTFFLTFDMLSERRYSGGLGFIRRFIQNKMDMICGSGYTIRKVASTYRYVYHSCLPLVYLSCLYHLFFMITNKFRGKKKTMADANLSNYLFNTYKSIMEAVNPLELGLSPEDVSICSRDDPALSFIARFHPEVLERLKEILSWKIKEL
jgi:glycosyltransferase involved in cell wall biosynthesis